MRAGSSRGALARTPILGPRPARAGEAVTAPPNMLSSAPSATITPNRLMTIPPTSWPPRVAGAGHYSPASESRSIPVMQYEWRSGKGHALGHLPPPEPRACPMRAQQSGRQPRPGEQEASEPEENTNQHDRVQ